MVEETDERYSLTGPIHTSRLILRIPEPADAPALARLANDRRIAEMVARLPHPYTVRDAEEFIGRRREEHSFAMTLKKDDTFIGMVGLQPKSGRNAAVLGYWIGIPFWNGGFATEAAQAMLDFGFGRLKLERIEVSCRVINAASRRVIQKCGFQYCGTGMISSLVAGRVATECFIMDRRCWMSLKAWGRA